jgi:hypothetical protein
MDASDHDWFCRCIAYRHWPFSATLRQADLVLGAAVGFLIADLGILRIRLDDLPGWIVCGRNLRTSKRAGSPH